MADRATPNLPARDLGATAAFYAPIGFGMRHRDPSWMILERGTMQLEFFPFPDLDPASSSFGACLRVDDLDALHAACVAAGIPQRQSGWPRIHHPPRPQPWGLRMATMVDLDGSLIRIIENRKEGA